jgi:hypothetical protein
MVHHASRYAATFALKALPTLDHRIEKRQSRQVTALHRRVELITYGLAPALCCTEPRFFTLRPCPIRGDMLDELGP